MAPEQQREKQHDAEDAWLASVMRAPTHNNLAAIPAGSDTLQLHKRLVHLATLREAALQQLSQLDAVKVSLTEKKSCQQGRLAAALEARLAAALAAVDPHRCAVWDLVKALEKEAARYSNILQGLQPSPPSEAWPSLTERYQQLQQQAQQQAQEQAVQPAELEKALAAGLEPCQVGHVQQVEQLRSEVDSLRQQLQHAQLAQQQQQQASQHNMLGQHNAAQQQQQQHVHCIDELRGMQQLAGLVLQQLQVYHSMQQGRNQTQQQQQQQGLCAVADEAASGSNNNLQQHAAHSSVNSAGSVVLAECHTLRQQLQQLSQAADALVQDCHAAASTAHAPVLSGCCADMMEQLALEDPLQSDPVVSQQPVLQQQQYSGAHTAMQELREAMQQQPWMPHNNSSSSSSSQELQVTKLRMAYQQMLHKVQSRYQQDLRQLEVKHSESLQAQSLSQQQALADLAAQHQEVCGRLAAAAKGEVDLQQQAAQLRADKKTLQQQVDKLQREVGGAAASAIAVVQVQHEQQMLAAREEQQRQMQSARQQLEQLQQQLQELRQQGSTEAVAALVAEATAKQAEQQQQQLQQLQAQHQAALQQREEQHLSLLQDLADMRQLQEESSGLSNNSSDAAAGAQPPPRDIQQLLDSCTHVEQLPLQQQQGTGSGGGDAMNALIAAVLGNGPIGRAQQRAHQNRLAQQQQQQAAAVCRDPQSELDRLLGLSSSEPHSSSAAAAPANAALAAAMERARVAGTCQPALQDISHSSVCNAAAPGINSSCKAPPWRPPSPTGGQHKQRQQQQWQQWQQRGAAGTSGSPSSRSPSPTRRQQQQQQQPGGQEVLLACVRCGQSEGAGGTDGSPCCFHPGLVAAPGPLMYGPEWCACRARCTPDMPGCYTRREHFFAPTLAGNKSSQQVAAGGGSNKQPAASASPAGSAGALSSQQQQQQRRSPSKKQPSAVLGTAVVSRGRYVGGRSPPSKAGVAVDAPEPRSTLPSPKPSMAWRG